MCCCHGFPDHWGNGFRILCPIKHSKRQPTELYRQMQSAVREWEGSVGAVGKATLKMFKIPWSGLIFLVHFLR